MMQHWQPDRPARPAPMERWVFVVMIFECGLCIGGAVVGGFIYGQVWTSVLLTAVGAVAGCYVQWRVKESGWPK